MVQIERLHLSSRFMSMPSDCIDRTGNPPTVMSPFGLQFSGIWQPEENPNGYWTFLDVVLFPHVRLHLVEL